MLLDDRKLRDILDLANHITCAKTAVTQAMYMLGNAEMENSTAELLLISLSDCESELTRSMRLCFALSHLGQSVEF